MQLQEVYNSSLEFLSPLTPENTYKVIVKEAEKLLDAKYATILLHSHDGLRRVYSSSSIIAKTIVRKQGRTMTAFKKKKPSLSLVHSEKDIHKPLYDLGIRSIIFIPLSYKRKNIGVLNVLPTYKKRLSNKDFLLLKLFGSMASLAIHKADHYKSAKQSIMARNMLIAMASHELKTPLTTITLYSQMLLNKISQGILPDNMWIKTLNEQVKWLNRLVNDILQVDMIKKHNLHYSSELFSFKELVDKAAISFQATYPLHILQIVDGIGKEKDIVKGDYYKFLQVVTNLLTNAGKFSISGSKVTVTLGKQKQEVVCSIQDTGQGIDKEDLPHIFKGFYKGRSHHKEGMGLGLFLVKKIITHANGRIFITSEVNKGTCITLSIPLA